MKKQLRMLTKRFNVDFVVSNNKYVKRFFYGSFTNHRLEQILDIFNASSGIKWRYIPSENKLIEKSKVEIY